jgi:CMP-N,N'-diacetyllegionaminic acid synthase
VVNSDLDRRGQWAQTEESLQASKPSVLGIIPARRGSKGLPGKNIRTLAGKPLVNWTIEQALAATSITVVHVSTDCPTTAEIARKAGADVPYLRPTELASDEATTMSVIDYALDFYEGVASQRFDYVVLLEPTSPLRAEGDIDRAIGLLHEHADDFDSLVTLGFVGPHPSVTKQMDGLSVTPFCPDRESSSRRQDFDEALFPYVIAHVAKTATLRAEGTFYAKRCMGMPIERYQSFEIDDIYDFLSIEAVMRYEWGVG